MKYKLTGILAAVLMLATAFIATAQDSDNPRNRIHQHRTARQPDAGCSCNGEELCTHLPLVIIDTNGADIPGEPIGREDEIPVKTTKTAEGEEMLKAHIRVMSDDAHNHHPSDQPDLESDMEIRIRGNSSRYFDKKGYLIRLIDENGKHKEKEVMGMPAHYEWALHGPFLDKSLIRNYMWYNIAGELMEYSPNVRFCEVILNGQYKGLYVMMETITNGEDCRLNITKPIGDTNKTGYLLRVDRGSNTPVKNIETFTNYTYRNLQSVDIQYPRSGDLTPEMADAIAWDFSNFEKSLYSFDYDTHDYGYQHNINVQSFVDYFVLNEFTTNYDAGSLSTYIYRDIGGKYNMVIWDFNSACDNYRETTMAPQRFELQGRTWYYMLTKEEAFTDQIIRRYRQLRKSYLSDEYLNQYIDDTVAYLGDAVERNFEVWGYTFDKNMAYGPERNAHSHQEAIEQIKEFIKDRGSWMDENIEVLRQYSHESKNKKFNH